ncbi:MAG: 3-isopropylmalate dehydratase small subunit [Proteobacteria bacterium]|nr:3-isopropylmalate dehydratase small subunit [Pseudomonadota bacterium]
MLPFTRVSGSAAPLPQANVDTDVIMPKQFLKGITREGLAAGLFYDLRYDAGGSERSDFILNRPGYRESCFLVVGPNFGCGSSREHAVWGLQQWGIRALIGSTFASIFQDNCFKNGLLPMSLPPEQVVFLQNLCADPAQNTLRVDLASQLIHCSRGARLHFEVDPLRKDDLLCGRDAIDATLKWSADIARFEAAHWAARPWLEPQAMVR